MIDSIIRGPYFVIIVFAVVIALLFLIRHYLKNAGIRPTKSNIIIGHAQILGKRKEQEDYYSTASTPNGIVAVLADGMGGFTNGKMASSTAVNTFIGEFSRAKNIHPIDRFMIDTANICNARVIEKGKGENVGTTLVVVIISGGYLYWASVGDSALVLFRNGEFINLNKKHIFESVLEERYISGKISKEELVSNSLKKRLTSYIGQSGLRDIEISEKNMELKKGDKVILCSDGVYNTLSEIEMERILSKKITPNDACYEIMELIKRKNSRKQDNASIIILEKSARLF